MSDPSPDTPGRAATARRLVLALVVLGLIAVGAWYGLGALRPVAVVEAVVSGPAIDAKTGSVTVSEDYATELKSELPGRLLAKDFNLDPGETVKQGQILAQLDDADQRLALERLEIDYEAMKKRFATDQSTALNLKSAEFDLSVSRLDHEQGRISDADLNRKELAFKLQTQAAKLEEINHEQLLATAENGIEVQRNAIAKMTLHASFDGVVKAVYAHPGDLIGAGDPIAGLITLRKVVVGKISDVDFAKIRVGQSASVLFIPYGAYVFNGKVSKILPTADPETQRHVIFLDVDIPEEKLVPGINGEVSVVVGREEARAVIPRRALFSLDGDSVFVVRDGVVRRQAVEKGFVWTKGVEIVKGLEPGDQVIVEGLEDFRVGERVRVREVPSDIYTQVAK